MLLTRWLSIGRRWRRQQTTPTEWTPTSRSRRLLRRLNFTDSLSRTRRRESDEFHVISDHSVFIGDARQPTKHAPKSVAKPDRHQRKKATVTSPFRRHLSLEAVNSSIDKLNSSGKSILFQYERRPHTSSNSYDENTVKMRPILFIGPILVVMRKS